MTGYDPQSGRARPKTSAESPVDGLLGGPLVEAEDEAVDGPSADEVPVEEQSDGEAGLPEGSDAARPFEVPPVEMTDERADRLQRLKVLVAVTALAVLLLAWRRRRRH